MPPQQVDYDKLAKEHGGTPVSATPDQAVDYDALAREMGGTPARFQTENVKDVYGHAVVGDSGVGGFLEEATKSINPRLINAAIQQAFWHPIETAKGLHSAQDKLRLEAGEAFKKGDTATGLRKVVDWLIPILGPRLSEAGDFGAKGDVSRMLGATTDVAVNLFGQKAIPSSLPVLPRIGAKQPAAVAEAVQFGLREGIPVDVATASGNRFIGTAQKVAEESILGSHLVGPQARAAQTQALTATADRLATRASPTAVTADLAGQALRDAVASRAAAYNAAADTAYSRLRALETQAATPVQTGVTPAGQPILRTMLAVDTAPTKAAMKPIYQALQEENALVPFMSESGKGRALVALDRLMKAPDLAPLSIADGALGELKSLARVDETFRRTMGQGIAAAAVTNLEKAVRTTAQGAGPDVFRALVEGRAATVNKSKTIEVLNKLDPGSKRGAPGEPRAFFTAATRPKDAGIKQLRALAGLAPDELRQVGRAWLEETFAKAGPEGWLKHADGMFAEWQKLYPQTKQMLFRDAAHVKDLDNFFLLVKKMSENPNPSGSGLAVIKGGELAALWSAPGAGLKYTLTAPLVAKLLLDPRATRLLVQGLRLPVNAKVARAAWVGQLGRLLEAQHLGAPIPAGGEEDARKVRPSVAPGTAPAPPRR